MGASCPPFQVIEEADKNQVKRGRCVPSISEPHLSHSSCSWDTSPWSIQNSAEELAEKARSDVPHGHLPELRGPGVARGCSAQRVLRWSTAESGLHDLYCTPKVRPA